MPPKSNSAPLAVHDHVEVPADGVAEIPVLTNDRDPDDDRLSIVSFTLPAHGTVANVANNTFRYTPAPGYVGDDTFTYRVDDGRGGSSEGRVDVKVVEPNAPPVAASDHVTTVQDTAVRLDLLANDADPDDDPLSIVGVTVPNDGILEVHDDQTVTYTPNPDFLGTDSFSYTVTDGRGHTSSVTAEIEVVPPNEAPTGISLDATRVAENAEGAVVGKLEVADPDADDTHRFTVDDDRFEVVDGALKLKADTALDAEAEPEVTLRVTATDAAGLAHEATFKLTVEDVNEAPTGISLDATRVAENAEGVVVGKLEVADPDADDTHRF
ncbi:MAG: Ig-like domain-containing protein, partial [Alphaproteobacteria bacterium]